MKSLITIFAVAALFVTCVPGASAARTIGFKAVVTSVNGTFCQCPIDIQVGDSLWGSYSFDEGASDIDPGTSVGLYESLAPPFGIQVHHELHSFVSEPLAPALSNNIRNDAPGPLDQFIVQTANPADNSDPFVGGKLKLISLGFTDYSASALNSDANVTDAPNIGEWTFADLEIFGNQFEWSVFATITETTLIPTGLVGQPAPSITISNVFPNPSNGEVAFRVHPESPAEGAVKIFDARGRLVTTLFEGTIHNATTFQWAGRFANDQQVPSGVYFVRFDGEAGEVHARKFLILR